MTMRKAATMPIIAGQLRRVRRARPDLGAPRRILTSLDADIRKYRELRYPTRFSDRYFRQFFVWVGPVPIFIAAVIARIGIAFHYHPLTAIGAFMFLTALLALLAGTVIAATERCRSAWHFADDAKERQRVESGFEDRAFRRLRGTTESARQLEQARLIGVLRTTVLVRAAAVIAASAAVTWYASAGWRVFALHEVVTFLTAHNSPIFVGATLVGGLLFVLQVQDSWLRRKIHLLTTSLGEDPRDLTLPQMTWPKLKG